MLIFPLIGLLSLFADHEGIVQKRRPRKEACLDRTGVQYHERLDEIVKPPCQPSTFYWYWPGANGDSLQYVKTNHVKTMVCDDFGRNDTLREESSIRPGEFYTVHFQRSFHARNVWSFDEAGNLLSLVQYNDTVDMEVRYRRDYTYDKQGYVLEASSYSLEDGISKQYRGYTSTNHTKCEWSHDHLICDLSYDSKLVSLPGASKSDRKAWDNEKHLSEHWEFNDDHRPIHFTGEQFGHDCSVYFIYDSLGHLLTRKTLFKDCDGGFTDSIKWIGTAARPVALHYFAVLDRGKLQAWSLLETVYYSSGHVFLHELADGAVFPGEEFRNLRGTRYTADYSADQLSREYEGDSAQPYMVGIHYTYQVIGDQNVRTCTWVPKDSTGVDTIRITKTYYRHNGLLTAVDVFNFKQVWWRGTWYFPEYFDLDERECYRFRYEFYQ